MVSYLTTHFALITISYFHYSVVTKIDILADNENKPINYYTLIKGETGARLWTNFNYNSTYKIPLCEKYPEFCKSYYPSNHTWINELMTKFIQLNMIDQVYNPYFFNYRFYLSNKPYKPLNIENLVHRGYIYKDIFSLTKVRKILDFSFEQDNRKKIKG